VLYAAYPFLSAKACFSPPAVAARSPAYKFK